MKDFLFKQGFRRAVAGVIVVCAAAAGVGQLSAAPDTGSRSTRSARADRSAGEFTGITRTPPLRHLELSFNGPGVVAEIGEGVEEGATVKEGDLLMRQETSVEKERLAFMQEELKSSQLEIDAANAELEHKQVLLKDQERLWKKKATSETDLREAQVAVKIAKIKVAASEQALKQGEQKVKVQKKEMELKELRSTIDGVIRKVDVGVGEVADPGKPAVTIVSNDRLWVEVNLPVAIIKGLEVGDELSVRYPDEAADAWEPAPIIFFDPIADPTSGRQRVVLGLDNKGEEAADTPGAFERASGIEVIVKLPQDKLAAAGEK